MLREAKDEHEAGYNNNAASDADHATHRTCGQPDQDQQENCISIHINKLVVLHEFSFWALSPENSLYNNRLPPQLFLMLRLCFENYRSPLF